MRWKSGRRSSNVEDRRGSSPIAASGAGGGLLLRLLPLLLRGRSLKTLIVVGVLAVIAHFLGIINLPALLSGTSSISPQSDQQPANPEEDQLADFVSVVLADTEETWTNLFQQQGMQYREPTLVLFSGAVQSACGLQQAAVGPFYCPPDQKVYIDLSFYEALRQQHGAPGDFAQAYVIAHEIGHHVQNLLGTSNKVHQARQSQSESEANQMSVRLELQADCYAGVWGNKADRDRGLIEAGDLDEALNAAEAIGDDRLQKQSRGYVVPESFTHGTSEQRHHWFKVGFESGDPDACDTFAAGI